MAEFAERLNRLFEAVHPATRGPHTVQEVAVAINAEGQAQVSRPYLSQLRSGQKTNPSANTVAALARFFRVRTDYFYDDGYADAIDRDLEMIGRLRDSGLQRTASRALDLSADAQDTITSLVESLRRAEGLSTDGPGSPQD